MGQVKWSELRGNRDYVALALERGFMVMVRRVGETRRRWVCRWEVQSNSATLDKRFTRCLFNSNSFAGPAALAELCSLLSVILLLHQIGSFTGSSSQSVCQSVSLSFSFYNVDKFSPLLSICSSSLRLLNNISLWSIFASSSHIRPVFLMFINFKQLSVFCTHVQTTVDRGPDPDQARCAVSARIRYSCTFRLKAWRRITAVGRWAPV